MKKMLFMALALLMAEGAMAARIDLSTLKNGETFYAKNNDQLYSKLSSNAKIVIPDGAVVWLDGAYITHGSNLPKTSDDNHAGIICKGDAVIVIDGECVVQSYGSWSPGIFIEKGHTLTIRANPEKPDSKLTVSAQKGAAIGAGYKFFKNILASNHSCGNIVIQSGIIKAKSVEGAAIGGSFETSCGDITITGGTVFATSNSGKCAAIGSGYHAVSSGSKYWSECGKITISGGEVEANALGFAAGIGSGYNGICGPIEITDKVKKLYAYGYHSIGKGYFSDGKTYRFDGLTLMGVSYPNGLTDGEYSYPKPTPLDPTPVCDAPTGLKVLMSGAKVTVSWTPTSEAEYYVRYKPTSSDTYRTKLVTDGTSYVLDDLLPGTQYQVSVVAICGVGSSASSSEIKFTTNSSTDPELLCPTPKDLLLMDCTETEVKIRWTPGSEEQQAWYLYIRKKGSSQWTEYTVNGKPGDDYKETWINGLEADTEYEMYITGVCYIHDQFIDNPSKSNMIEFRTKAPVCEKPTDLSCVSVSKNTASITWEKGWFDQDTYELTWHWASSSTMDRHTVTVSGDSYTIKGLTAGRKYVCFMRADCGNGKYSDYTSDVEFTTLEQDVCDVPGYLGVSDVSASTATLHWEPGAASQTKYKVRWRIEGTTTWVTRDVENATSYNLTSLERGSYYEFQVSGYCASIGSWSDYSSSLRFVTKSSNYHIDGGWIYYDNSTPITSFGPNNNQLFYWAVMYPANTLSTSTLDKVGVFVSQYNKQTINVYVYEGGSTPRQGKVIGMKSFTPSQESGFAMVEVEFPYTVNFDITKNLWIVLSATAGYPAIVCANVGDPNSRWYSMDSVTWGDLAETEAGGGRKNDYSFMIRAHFGNGHEDIERIASSEIGNQKVLKDGKLYIVVGDKMYDAQGKEVK